MVGYHVYSILLAELILQICVSVMLLLLIIKVKLSMYHTRRMYEAVKVQLNSFLLSALDKGNVHCHGPMWKQLSLPTG